METSDARKRHTEQHQTPGPPLPGWLADTIADASNRHHATPETIAAAVWAEVHQRIFRPVPNPERQWVHNDEAGPIHGNQDNRA